jgi:hypothetical protein|tara:strand:- start:4721 stop:4972 length:252 start_codon:yes stop_codon:yes gene_type:complete
MITHDMIRAREIWRNKIRTARKPILEELDIQFMRTTEESGDTSRIIIKKNHLRDFPQDPRIDASITIEELREIWDTTLLGDKV